ncbi:unnamed protein product, partial [Durusdinium trenchii]
HQTRHGNDETEDETEPRQWVNWAGDSGLSFRDVVGPPWCEEIEEEAEEQDREVRRSTYTHDDGYTHETEVRVRMVRMEKDTSASEEDEDEGSESEVNTDRRSLAEHLEADGEDEYIRLEGEEYERYKTEMIEIDRGIEVYLIMKIREFNHMVEEDPGDEDLPE